MTLVTGPVFGAAQDDLAIARFQEVAEAVCGKMQPSSYFAKPQRFDLQVPDDFGEYRPVTLWQFKCKTPWPKSVFVIDGPYGGPEVALFARPDMPAFDDETVPLGFAATRVAHGATFDAETLTLTTHDAKDLRDGAFEEATYRLTPDHFRLIRYETDRSPDGAQLGVTVYRAP